MGDEAVGGAGAEIGSVEDLVELFKQVCVEFAALPEKSAEIGSETFPGLA